MSPRRKINNNKTTETTNIDNSHLQIPQPPTVPYHVPPAVNTPPPGQDASTAYEEIYRRAMVEERAKRQLLEVSLDQKTQQMETLRKKCHYFETRSVMLEGMLQQKMALEGSSNVAAMEEEAESSYNLNSGLPLDVMMKCTNCRSRPANMLWLPCHHVCVCSSCDGGVGVCPLCNALKSSSFMVNFPVPPIP